MYIALQSLYLNKHKNSSWVVSCLFQKLLDIKITFHDCKLMLYFFFILGEKVFSILEMMLELQDSTSENQIKFGLKQYIYGPSICSLYMFTFLSTTFQLIYGHMMPFSFRSSFICFVPPLLPHTWKCNCRREYAFESLKMCPKETLQIRQILLAAVPLEVSLIILKSP